MATFPAQAKCYIAASKETQQLGKPRPGVYIEISLQKLKVIQGHSLINLIKSAKPPPHLFNSKAGAGERLGCMRAQEHKCKHTDTCGHPSWEAV